MTVKYIGFLATAMLLSGCMAKMSPEAGNVQLHSQISGALDECKKLGPVKAEASGIGRELVRDQAKANLRQLAYDKYKADSVVLVDMYRTTTTWYANGIAYKCFK